MPALTHSRVHFFASGCLPFVAIMEWSLSHMLSVIFPVMVFSAPESRKDDERAIATTAQFRSFIVLTVSEDASDGRTVCDPQLWITLCPDCQVWLSDRAAFCDSQWSCSISKLTRQYKRHGGNSRHA